MKNNFIIAVDGPSSSGKGTIAKKIAESLSFIYLDTGAMYRALTLFCMENNVDLSDENEVLSASKKVDIQFTNEGNTLLNGRDVSSEIRSNEVTKNVSRFISIYPKVREQMVRKQQKFAEDNNVVVDGRDIGTVVFPNADIKLFITASLAIRAERRYNQNMQNGIKTSLEETRKMLAKRDRTDIGRDASPLLLTSESIILDSTNLSADETLAAALGHISYK